MPSHMLTELNDDTDQAPPTEDSTCIHSAGQIDPNKGRGLVENCVEEKAVDDVHCLARSYESNPNFVRLSLH